MGLPPDTDAVVEFRAARARVLEVVRAACLRVGRDPDDVTLVAVSKTVEAARLGAAVQAGLTLLGENRVQEAESKAPLLPGARWHLIGPLQSNKAKRAVELFDVVQVNVDLDPAKAGFLPSTLETELPALAGLPNLRLLGLMTVGRLVGTPAEARATFVRLRELSVGLRGRAAELGRGLSMGMSDDYPVAVEEGATVIRVGRALFGGRPGGVARPV